MECFDNCVKYLLLITNLIIFVLSCVVLGLGIWILVDKPSFVDLMDKIPNGESIPIYTSAVILFLIVAISSVIISFFGCCGAYKESKCMLTTYFLMVLSLLVLITVAVAMGYTQGMDKLKEPFIDSLSKYDDSSKNVAIKEIVAIWDEVQQENSCCGVDKFSDWSEYNQRYSGKRGENNEEVEDNNNLILMNVKVPKSCCKPDLSGINKAKCQQTPTTKNGAFIVGCLTVVEEQINSHQNVIGATAIAVIVIMVANMLIALYMCTCAATDDRDAVARPKRRLYTNPGQGSRV